MLALLQNLPKETLTTQLGYGAVLMLLGMATVFLFLVILIFATKAMSKVVTKISKPSPVEVKKPATANAPKAAPAANDAAIAAAIAAAYDKSKN